MLRFSTIVWMIGIAGAVCGLYFVKYRVQSLHEQAAQVEKQLHEETEAVHVLEAEWTYLNRPDRLRRLAEHYLTLTPADPRQLSELDAILPRAASQVSEKAPSLPLTPARIVIKADDDR